MKQCLNVKAGKRLLGLPVTLAAPCFGWYWPVSNSLPARLCIPFLTSARAITLSRYFRDFATISSDGRENLISVSDGGGKGSSGWMARCRMAESIRCTTGENDSSIGSVSMGPLIELVEVGI